jgi:hypothetical protein
MKQYSIILNKERFSLIQKPFYITYSNGEEIDFNTNAIGYVAAKKIEDIPAFLQNVIEEKGQNYNSSGFWFGPVTEGDKVWVEAGMVEVYVMDVTTLISFDDFIELSLQLANKALEAVEDFQLKEKGLVDDRWIDGIKIAKLKLEEKLDSKLRP